jgi:dTDP-4-dehydrorhamnose 3,5-epimerase
MPPRSWRLDSCPRGFPISAELSYTAAVERELPKGCRLITLQVRGDERGSLIALERATGVPFDVARVYFIYETQPGVSRGFHAHRDLRQLAVCVSGSCTMVLDDGKQRTQLRLDRPDTALEIGSMIWREMHDFSPDCVVVVLADRPYDEADYIRDYSQFIELVSSD